MSEAMTCRYMQRCFGVLTAIALFLTDVRVTAFDPDLDPFCDWLL